ncbi:MAG: glycosyltransferase family 2 protein [bacterium]
MSISAIIITKNEARNIARCLRSLSFTDEQIVVDSFSRDRTIQLANDLGALVFSKAWSGYGPQKNYGREQAGDDWVLSIDADEEVTPKLRKEIIAAAGHGNKNFYWLRIVTIFLGHPLKHLYGHNMRLFRKDSGQWTNSCVHEQVINKQGQLIKLHDRNSAVLKSPLLHHSHTTINSYLKKMHRYTTLDAQQMHKTGRHRSGRPVQPAFYLPYYLCLRQFIKLYFYRRGLLDGYAGFIWCVLSAYYEYEMAKKYLKLCA